MAVKKIVYLFGAGATHAEILNLKDNADAKFRDRNGLLISDVSKRVMKEAQKVSGFKRNIEFVSAAEGSLNIELLISMISANQIAGADSKSKILKKLVQDDIESRLSAKRKKQFCLHKALIELHKNIKDRETHAGSISLNYDDILDEAHKANDVRVDYCHQAERDQGTPLLKLHGSFNWINIAIYGKKHSALPIIPLGINKNYLIPPYNFIWGRAYELLVQCDILRIIGCSLNQNDIGLVDLLFKAHLERASQLEMEIIDFQAQGDWVKNNYGFFPGIVKPKDIEGTLIANEQIYDPDDGGNPFKIWLKAKAQRMIGDEIPGTKYLRKCF